MVRPRPERQEGPDDDWFKELIVVALVVMGFLFLFFPPISLVLWFVAFVMRGSNSES